MYPKRNKRHVFLSSCCLAAFSVAMSEPAAATTYTVAPSTTQTVATQLTGSDNVLVTGGGTLALTNATNNYTGGTQVIGASLLQIDSDAELGAGALALGDGATNGQLVLAAATTLGASRSLTLNTGNQTINTGTFTDTVASLIAGTGSLVKTGSGTLVLTATNTYSGTTTISAGTLQIGNADTTGWIASTAIVDNATLAFNRTDAVTYAGVISGTGAVKQLGTGTLILTAANTYTGGTTISAGTLQIGAAGTTGSVAGNISNAGALVFNRADALTYSGVISGAGTMTVTGGNTLTLTGANTLSGSTTIASGSTLALSGAGALASSPLIINGSFDISALTGASTTTKSLSGTGNVILGSKTMMLSSSPASPFLGVISGVGNLTVNSGTTTLAGANTYTGTTTIASGATLQIGAQTATGSIVSTNIIDNGTVTFSHSDSFVFSTVIAGTGAVKMNGVNGVTTLNAVNTYTGLTTASVGTLVIGDASHTTARIAGAATVSSTGILTGYGTIAGNVTNQGVIKTGYGSVGTLSVGGTYTQTSTGSLLAEISPSGASLLNVTGTATLAGTFSANIEPGIYTQSVFPILRASAISGAFASAAGVSSGVSGDVAYGIVYPSSTEADIVVVPRTVTQVYGDVVTAAYDNARALNDIAFDHAAFDGCSVKKSCSAWTSWVQGVGGFDHVDGEGATAAFNTHSWGAIGGVGYHLDEGISFNAAVGANSGKLSVSDSSASSNSSSYFGSGTVHVPYRNVGVDLGGFYMSNTSSIVRVTGSNAIAASKLHSTIRGVTGQVSYAFLDGGVVPFAKWTSASISYGPFAEAGGGVFNLSGVHGSAHVSVGELAVRLGRTFTVPHTAVVVRPHVVIGADYNPWPVMRPVYATLSSTASTYLFDGIAPSGDKVSAMVRAGLEAQVTGGLSVQADYSGHHGKKQDTGAFTLGATYRF